MLDVDDDGGLQEPELLRAPVHKRCAHLIGTEHFVALDTNADNRLTPDELAGDHHAGNHHAGPGILLPPEQKKDEL